MTREEMRDCLKLIQANYENWKPADLSVTLNLWTESFKDDPAELVKAAIWAIIQTSTSDFAPKIGQVRAKMLSLQNVNEITDSQAWVQVYNALCDANYHAESRYNELPDDIRRAVGGADQLRAWAVMDEQSLSVAESNFKRTYRAVVSKRKELEALPGDLRPQIAETPVVQIAERDSWENYVEHGKADPDVVAEMLSGWRDDM